HAYLRTLEEALMALCAQWGVSTARLPGQTGVWTADKSRKLASLGIAIRRWGTFHGFALNVTTELSRFSTLNPCGLPAQVMTSLAAEGATLDGRAPTVSGIVAGAVRSLSTHLKRDFGLCTAADCGVDALLATARTPAAIG